MSFYDSMADGLSKRAGVFVVVVLLITGLMFVVFGTMEQTYEASSDPTGPAFEARKIIGDEFTATSHSIPFIIEARGEDVLSKEVLTELYANEEIYRSSEIYQDYQYVGYDTDLDQPTYGLYTAADGVQEILVGSFGTTLDQASEDLVKVALHYFLEASPGLIGTLSTDNSSEVRDFTIGPMEFQDIRVWKTKAFINTVLLDYEKVNDDVPEVLDQEAINLDIMDMLSGDEDSYAAYGIAIDLNTEINTEAQTSVMLVFIAVVAILIIVYVSLRSGAETLLVGMLLLFLLFWIFGAVRLLDLGSSQYINLLLPIAIISLGVDYALHSVHRYHEERRTEEQPRKALRKSIRMVGPALFIAMVTTSIAFFSNISSDLQSVQQFGIAAGLAIIFAFLLLGLALPAVRMLLQERKFLKKKDKEVKVEKAGEGAKEEKATKASKKKNVSDEPARVWKALAKLGSKPVLVIIIVALITIPLGYRGMQIEGKMPVEDFINSESDFVVSLTTMNKYFKVGESGMVLLQADYRDPEMLATMDTIDANIQDNEEATPFQGIPTITWFVRNLTRNDFVFKAFDNMTMSAYLELTDDDDNGLPDTSAQVERVYEFIIEEDQGIPLYQVDERIVSHDRLVIQSLFSWNKGADMDLAVVVVSLPHSGDASKVAEGREELKEDLEFLQGMGFAYNEIIEDEYYVITDVGNYNPFTREEQFSALTDSMARSVFISIVLCLVVMVLLFKSLKLGIVSIIPMTLVVAWLYGIMEITGNYLNSVTVTIAAISVGVGVDYAIHVTHRFREEHEKDGDYEAAMTRTLSSTGNALAFSAGSTFIGFLIIGFSPMTMFSKFGFLTALMIAMAFIAAVVVLPALLSLTVKKKEDGQGTENTTATPEAED